MKNFAAILLAIAFQGMFSAINVKAQAVAIGHVSAQVVESVSVSSQAVTGIKMDRSAVLDNDNLKLGVIHVNSGKAVACNVVLKPAELSGTNGSSFTIEPSANNSVRADSQRADGNQILKLTGRARMMKGQSSGLYQGSYTIIFAYN